MADLNRSNIQLSLPRGWEGEIVERLPATHPLPETATGTAVPGTLGAQLAAAAGPATLATVHVANFPLPPARGDYGSGAVEAMGDDGVFVALLEFAPDSMSTALFSHQGVPRPLDPAAFSPRQLQRPQRNQAGLQTFFTSGGRPFCLYVVIGNHLQRDTLVAQANALLDGLQIM